MKDIFAKTFGGLTKQYLARQLFFGVAMAALFITMMKNQPNGIGIGGMFMFVLNAGLYPYSRFVYERAASKTKCNTLCCKVLPCRKTTPI
jgi:hypothetical protein